MRKAIALAAAAMLPWAVDASAAPGTTSVTGPQILAETGRLGPVRRFEAAGTPTDLVVVLSDGGWTARADDLARTIATSGRVVLGIETEAFEAAMAGTDDACSFPADDLEAISRQVQKELPFDQYRAPVLVGLGSGAAVAYAAVTEALPTTFAAGIGLGFCPVYLAPLPFCPDAPTADLPPGITADGNRHTFGPASSLEAPWLATFRPDCPEAAAEGLMKGTPGAERLGADDVGTVVAALDRIAAATGRPDGTNDIPVVEIPADAGSGGDTLAIFYSGDGGWRDIDRQIGQEIARSGVPVVGVDSLRYFWRERQPEEIARDLDRLITHYTRIWRRPKVLLVGYSFGADILPFAVNRLSNETKSHVRLVSLLGFATRADFEVKIGGWLGVGSDDAAETLPELGKMTSVALQCVYGADEEDTGCTAPEMSRAESIRMPGGHHFDGDYQRVARAILRSGGAAR